MPPESTEATATGGFALTFVDGKGVLASEGRPLAVGGRIDRLELEIPNLRFPFDLSGGIARFQHRRCRLRELALSTGTEELAALLRRAPLGDFGVLDPQVEVAGGFVAVEARVVVGQHQAPFTMRVAVRGLPPRGVRLSAVDVRVHGFLPVPAPLVAAAFFVALGAAPAEAPGSGFARLVGPTDVELDLVDLALYAFLVPQGWRVPDRGAVGLAEATGRDRLAVRFALSADADAAANGTHDALAAHAAGVQRFERVEAALLAGDLPAALTALRDASPIEVEDPFGTSRLFQVLCASPATLSEAAALSEAALARWPGFAPALLAQAIADAHAGRPADAAQAYQRLAAAASGDEARGERAAALVAAAVAWEQAGDLAAAGDALKGALAARPGHRGAARRLADRLTADGRWDDLLRLLWERAADESDPAQRAALHAESGLVLLDRLGDAGQARDRFQQAIRISEREPTAWEGLGRAAIALDEPTTARGALERARVLYASRGDAAAEARVHVHLAELETAAGDAAAAGAHLEHAAALDPAAALPLRLAADLAVSRGAHERAVSLYEAALARAASPEERAVIAARLAEALNTGRGDAGAARLLVEGVLVDAPGNLAALDQLAALLESQGALAEWEVFLRRAVARAQTPEERRGALERLADLARRFRWRPVLRDAVAGLWSEEGVDRAALALELAECAGTDRGAAADAAHRLEAAMASAPPEQHERLTSRLAALQDVLGDVAAARRALRATLDAGGEPLAVAWRRLVHVAAGAGEAPLPEGTDDTAPICERVLAIAEDDVDARLVLAGHLWRAGDKARSAKHFERLIAAGSDGPVVAEARLRLAQWARVVGRLSEANRHLAAALEKEPAGAPADVLVEALEAFGRGEDLVAILGRRASAGGLSPDGQRALRRTLAGVLERLGRADEAEQIYREILADEPRDVATLERLAEIFRREARTDALIDVLEALWQLADRPDHGGLDAEEIGLELAAALEDGAGRGERAEEVLRRVLEREPHSRPALEALSALLLARGAVDEADAVLARRVDLDADSASVGPMVLERARARLGSAEGDAAALALLRATDAGVLSADAAALRAELAEKAGDVTDVVACVRRLHALAQADGDKARASALRERLSALALRPEADPGQTVDVLEEIVDRDPQSADAAERLFQAYGHMDDRRARVAAWTALAERTPALTVETRARIHLAAGHLAEDDGDLAAAERAYDAALSLEPPAPVRADLLVGRARVMVARKRTADALADLDEAMGLAPEHAGAQALAADVAYRNQEWELARRLYAALVVAPDAKNVVSPVLLAYRRGELAEMFGDEAEAEAAYQEAVGLDPRHIEARDALANIALYRGDLRLASRRLEDVLRLVPLSAVEKLSETRQQLGEIYAQLEDFAAARHYLELVVAERPDPSAALELLAGVYQRLGAHRKAAEACERLARVYGEPTQRAEALFRAGEILRGALGDVSAANDAYLRSSDLDPTFAPTLIRLAEYYWREGDLENLADVGGELVKAHDAGQLADDDVGLMIAIGALVARDDRALAGAAVDAAAAAPIVIAARLAEAAQRNRRRAPERLDPALTFFAEAQPGFDEAVTDAFSHAIATDPASPGALIVLGRLAERRGDTALARAAYSVALFLDPELPVANRLGALGAAVQARPSALAAGAVDHPTCRGPLRRVLAALAGALSGFPEIAGDGEPSGRVVPEPLAAVLAQWRQRLAAPAFEAVRSGEAGEIAIVATRPLTLVVGERVTELPQPELAFLAGRTFELARSGTFAVTALAEPAARELLLGVRAALTGEAADGELAGAAVWWLSLPDSQAALPSGDARAALLADVEEALSSPPALEAYVRGCRFTADRVGLLACGNPLAALRAVSGQQKSASQSRTDPIMAIVSVQRQEQLRASAPLRELVRFVLSPEYRALVG